MKYYACYTMGASWKHAKGNKLDTKGHIMPICTHHILYDYIYMRCSSKRIGRLHGHG